MEQVPKIVRDRLQTASAGDHLDANLLTAFAEKSLTHSEQAQVLNHLAACADCREVLSLSAPQYEMERGALAAAMPVPASSRWSLSRMVRWAAVAACVLVVGTAVLFKYSKEEKFTSFKVPPQPAKAEVAETPTSESRDRLEAKVEPMPSLSAKRGDRESSRMPQRKFAAKSLNDKNLRGMLSAPAMDKPASPSSPPPAVARDAATSSLTLSKIEEQEVQQKEAATDKAQDALQANETVSVEASAAPVATESGTLAYKVKQNPTTVGKLKAGAVAGARAGNAGLPNQPQAGYKENDKKDEVQSLVKQTTPRWTISPEGKLLRSLDLGDSWQPVLVAQNTVFRAVCVNRSEIWVGGRAGVLYYSSDLGASWQLIKPKAEGQALIDDITAIEFVDDKHGKLVTANKQVWDTPDGGQSWLIQHSYKVSSSEGNKTEKKKD